jgi:hypothetical protein
MTNPSENKVAIKDRYSLLEKEYPRTNLRVPRMCTRKKMPLQKNLIPVWFLCLLSTMLTLCASVVENLPQQIHLF